MIRYRRACLCSAFYCLCAAAVCAAWAQSTPAQQQPAPAQQQPKPEQPKKPEHPFEIVPDGQQPEQAKPPEAPAPQAPFETPKIPEAPKAAAGKTIEAVEFRGARRVPQDTLRALIDTKKGRIIDDHEIKR